MGNVTDVLLPGRKRRDGAIQRERLVAVRDAVARATAQARGGVFRVDWRRLSEDERRELVALVEKAPNPSAAGGLEGEDSERFEALAEKGANRIGHFDSTRDWAKLRLEIAETEADVKRPPPRPRYEQAGSVILPKQWTFDFLQEQVLWVSHLGLLVFLMSCLENGRGITRGVEVVDEDTMRIHLNRGLWGDTDPDGRLADWQSDLKHLCANQFFVLADAKGPVWTVKRGRRLLDATRARQKAA